MTLPFTVPDWLPWWTPVAVLVPVLLYLLVFLMMPMSVLGLKGRIDGLEARLDEIHEEIRMLALRLPEAMRGDGGYVQPERPPVLPPRERGARAPILEEPPDPEPPAPDEPPRRRFQASRDLGDERPERNEPRLGWPPS